MSQRAVFLERNFDRFSEKERDAHVVSALNAQLEFLSREGPAFWRQRLEKAGVRAVRTLEELNRIPILTKEEMRASEPWELVPPAYVEHVERCFGTSGTTGQPVFLFWTHTDWRALVDSVARMLSYSRPAGARIALNGYNPAHLAGQAYAAALRQLGVLPLERHYLHDDEPSTLTQFRTLRCDTLVLGHKSGLKKSGRTVQDLLAHEPSFFERLGVRWWIGSSSTFTSDVVATARSQGVEAVTNLYGSSEFGLMAFSCPSSQPLMHCTLGHVFIEVLGPDGLPVASGQRGRVVVSRLHTLHADGTLGPHTGTQILRLDTGDEATWLDEPCGCGLTSPRLADIRRS